MTTHEMSLGGNNNFSSDYNRQIPNDRRMSPLRKTQLSTFSPEKEKIILPTAISNRSRIIHRLVSISSKKEEFGRLSPPDSPRNLEEDEP